MRTTEAICPYCDHLLDAAEHVDDPQAKPSIGDFTVCLYCAQMLIFDAEMKPRKPWANEEAALRADRKLASELGLIQRAVRSLDRRNARGKTVR